MGFLPAVVGIERLDGTRVDLARADGTRGPIVLVLDDAFETESVEDGGTTKVIVTPPAGGVAYTATAPITLTGTAFGISLATVNDPGAMSADDKLLLNSATESIVNTSLVQRGLAGQSSFGWIGIGAGTMPTSGDIRVAPVNFILRGRRGDNGANLDIINKTGNDFAWGGGLGNSTEDVGTGGYWRVNVNFVEQFRVDATGLLFPGARQIKWAAGVGSLITDGDAVFIEGGPSGGTKVALLVRRNDDLSQGQEAWTSAGVFKRRGFFPPETTTTDATVTTAWAFTLTDNTTYTVYARVTADSSGADSAGYIRAVTVKRAGAGAVIVGAVTNVHTAEDVAGWDCTFDVSGNDVRLRVTGAAATTITWQADVIVNAKGY